MELAKYVDAITIDPEDDCKVNYKGGWKLLGNFGVCRGAESNCLRRPFQGRALPMSYLGTGTTNDSTEKVRE
jgi:hypothetical protein